MNITSPEGEELYRLVTGVNKEVETNNSSASNKRKTKRLEILEKSLRLIALGFIFSVIFTGIVYIGGGESPVELVVLNTVLGSSLTTIIGIVAGTSID